MKTQRHSRFVKASNLGHKLCKRPYSLLPHSLGLGSGSKQRLPRVQVRWFHLQEYVLELFVSSYCTVITDVHITGSLAELITPSDVVAETPVIPTVAPVETDGLPKAVVATNPVTGTSSVNCKTLENGAPANGANPNITAFQLGAEAPVN